MEALVSRLFVEPLVKGYLIVTSTIMRELRIMYDTTRMTDYD